MGNANGWGDGSINNLIGWGDIYSTSQIGQINIIGE